MLLNLGYIPMINKATRITNHSATLIDHIYTNSLEKIIKSGICLLTFLIIYLVFVLYQLRSQNLYMRGIIETSPILIKNYLK